jgi:hypothetical protein
VYTLLFSNPSPVLFMACEKLKKTHCSSCLPSLFRLLNKSLETFSIV